MNGSRITDEIIRDMKREQYFKKKKERNQCIVDSKKQCDICKYQEICTETE